MKLGIKEFQKQYPKVLKDLPIEITKYGETIAIVVSPKEYSVDPKVHTNTKKLPLKVHTLEEVKEKVHTESLDPFCKKHGGYKVSCGCK